MELLSREQRAAVLKYARRLCEEGVGHGMCQSIRFGMDYEFGVESFEMPVENCIMEFNYTVAKDMFGATGDPLDYWWPKNDISSRLKYFDWLIELNGREEEI